MAATCQTSLTFQYDGKKLRHKTTLHSIRRFADLEPTNQEVFKQVGTDADFVIVTKETIFHPQGGGQPSDEGTMVALSLGTEGAANGPEFRVRAVRMDALHAGQVLHLGSYAAADLPDNSGMHAGDTIEMAVDEDKRLLYSRLHTAGHVLGSAVRSLLEHEVPGFDELKASHFPDRAGCEFQGNIEGKWKEPIQGRVDEYLARKMPVEIDFWTEQDFKNAGLEKLIPDKKLLPPGEDRFRVVKIVGAEVYPCGGTHVDTTDLCGATTVKKISRSKGTSRVSYTVAP